ncbi:MAG: Rab family GTPase [Candidatus Hodarchaeota archaeon]
MELPKNWGILFQLEENNVNVLWVYDKLGSTIPKFTPKLTANLIYFNSIKSCDDILLIYFDNPNFFSELMIVSLPNNYFFLCGNPLITSKILKETNIPTEVHQLLTGNLVAQATIIYSTLWSDAGTDVQRKIDLIFREALTQMGLSPTNVGNGSISLSELKLPDLVYLHSYIRNELFNVIMLEKHKSWVYCIEKHNSTVLFHIPETEKYSRLDFITIIFNLILELFNTLPVSLIIGKDALAIVNLFFGEKFAIITNNLKLLKSKPVLKALEKLPENVQHDLAPSLSNHYYKKATDIIASEIRSVTYLDIAQRLEKGWSALLDLLLQQQTLKSFQKEKTVLNQILHSAEKELTDFLKKSSPDASTTQLKLLLLGDGAVGKTTSKHVFMGNPFRLTYQETMGVDFSSLNIKIERHTFQAQIWDLAGQQKFKQLRSTFYKGASGAIVMFDLSRPETLSNVEGWVDELNVHSSKVIPLVVFGNKKDLRNEGIPGITDEEAVEFVTKLKQRIDPENKVRITYLPGSAKTGENLKLAYHLVTCRASEDFFNSYAEKIAKLMKEHE